MSKVLTFVKVGDVKSPVRGTKYSAGIDFFVPNNFKITTLNPGDRINISSGIHVNIPHGYAMVANNKSGVSMIKGLSYTAGVVDEDYKEEVGLCLLNTSNHTVVIKPGEKILQFLLIPVLYAEVIEEENLEELYKDKEESDRVGGFGSTGTE